LFLGEQQLDRCSLCKIQKTFDLSRFRKEARVSFYTSQRSNTRVKNNVRLNISKSKNCGLVADYLLMLTYWRNFRFLCRLREKQSQRIHIAVSRLLKGSHCRRRYHPAVKIFNDSKSLRAQFWFISLPFLDRPDLGNGVIKKAVKCYWLVPLTKAKVELKRHRVQKR
jgi:hypothetical protein